MTPKEKKRSKLYIYVLVVLIILVLGFLIIGVPCIINELYKKNDGYITLWGAEEVFSYYGNVLAFIGTGALGILSLYQNHIYKVSNERNYRNEKRPIYQFEYSTNGKSIFLKPKKTSNSIGFNERVIECKLLDDDNNPITLFVTNWNNPYEFEFKLSEDMKYNLYTNHYIRIKIGYTDMFNFTVHDTYWLLITDKRLCTAILELRKETDNRKFKMA